MCDKTHCARPPIGQSRLPVAVTEGRLIKIRRAAADDAAVLARLVHIASEGFAEVFWRQQAAPGEDPWEVGRRRQAEKLEDGNTEIWVVDNGTGIVAGLTGYPIGCEPEQPDDDTPAMVRPLIELEALAPCSWYVNVLAALPGHRNLGLGSELLQLAEHRAHATRLKRLSIIVSDGNDGARRLYERHGYIEEARRPMVKDGWQSGGRDWVLMTRPV